MAHPAWWRDNRRIIVQLGLFAVCCCLAIWIRSIVAAETLGDLASVVLQVGAVVGFIFAAALALPAGRHARSLAERVALRVVPVGVLIVAGMFVKTSYADVSVALHALTEKSDDSQTVIALGPGGRDVRLSGSITEGAADSLRALLDAHPAVERIHLTSDGGLADEGEALRKVIAAHKLTTFVPDYCVSACTLAFLGGRDRLVMPDARLGFHAPYEEGLFNQTFAGDGSAERASYIASGVTPGFVDIAFKVKPEDIWTPPVDQLIAAHVATGIVDRYRFPDSNLDGNATMAGARAAVLSNFPLARAFEGAKPRANDIIAAWYLDAYRRGLSEGDIVDEVTDILGNAASLAMADADDETLVAFGRFLSQAMDAAETDEVCTSIGRNASLVEAANALNDGDETNDGDAKNDGDDNGEKLAVALLSRALQSHGRQSGHSEILDRMPAPAIALADTREPCEQLQDAYARALRRPGHAAATAIRAFVTRQQESPVAIEVEGVLAH